MTRALALVMGLVLLPAGVQAMPSLLVALEAPGTRALMTLNEAVTRVASKHYTLIEGPARTGRPERSFQMSRGSATAALLVRLESRKGHYIEVISTVGGLVREVRWIASGGDLDGAVADAVASALRLGAPGTPGMLDSPGALEDGGTTYQQVAWIAAAASVLAVVGAVTWGSSALGSQEEANRCAAQATSVGGTCTSSRYLDLVDASKQEALLADVSWVAAGISGFVGVTTYLLGEVRSNQRASGAFY